MKLLPAILLALLSTALFARDLDVQSIHATATETARLRQQIEPAFDTIERLIGLNDTRELTLVLIGGSKSFREIAKSDGLTMHAESVLGYAIPSKRRVVLNLSGVKDRGMDPIGVLRHELCHLVLGSSLRTQRPLWFEEGVCQYVESVAYNDLKESAGSLPFAPNYESLQQVSEGLRSDAHAGPSYTEVRHIIRYLVKVYGEPEFKKFVQALVAGAKFELAFDETFGQDLPTFESRWLKARDKWAAGGVWSWMGLNFGITIFIVTAALLIVVVVFLKRRRKGILALMKQQQKDSPDNPAWSFSDD